MAGQAKRGGTDESGGRCGPLFRGYDPWADEWARAGLSGMQILVMLKLCERLEFDEEGATAWYPAEEMARELGKSVRTINDAVSKLKRKGVLKLKNKPHRGACAVYYVMPSTPWPAQKVRAKTVANDQKGTDTSGSNRKKATEKQPGKLPAQTVPLRSKEGVPPACGGASRGNPFMEGLARLKEEKGRAEESERTRWRLAGDA